jgi:hypothetical protein
MSVELVFTPFLVIPAQAGIQGLQTVRVVFSHKLL